MDEDTNPASTNVDHYDNVVPDHSKHAHGDRCIPDAHGNIIILGRIVDTDIQWSRVPQRDATANGNGASGNRDERTDRDEHGDSNA